MEKTMLERIVAGERSGDKPRQRWENNITDVFGTLTMAGRIATETLV